MVVWLSSHKSTETSNKKINSNRYYRDGKRRETRGILSYPFLYFFRQAISTSDKI